MEMINILNYYINKYCEIYNIHTNEIYYIKINKVEIGSTQITNLGTNEIEIFNNQIIVLGNLWILDFNKVTYEENGELFFDPKRRIMIRETTKEEIKEQIHKKLNI